jgi:hypothetical protein
MKAASFEHKNNTGPATSSGVPHLASGVRERITADLAESSRNASVSGVSIQPGATALTRIPSGAHAAASDLVSCAIPPLLAV